MGKGYMGKGIRCREHKYKEDQCIYDSVWSSAYMKVYGVVLMEEQCLYGSIFVWRSSVIWKCSREGQLEWRGSTVVERSKIMPKGRNGSLDTSWREG